MLDERRYEMQVKGELNRTIMIYIDSYENGVPTGRFHIASSNETESFTGLSKLLIGVNNRLDKENFPQSFTALRKFERPRREESAQTEPIKNARGGVATFSVRILFRQNASWQGTVTWHEGNQEECFRSVLELIILMDNALEYSIEA